MTAIFNVAVIVISIVLLYGHFRWVLVDPHNPAARPGKAWTLLLALAATLMLLGAFAFADSGQKEISAALGAFALGWVVTPAIAPPEIPRPDEEPDAFERGLAKWKNKILGAAFKTILVAGLSVLVGWLIAGRPEYWVAAVLACVLSFKKIAPVMLMANQTENPILAADYDREFKAGILKPALIGILALIFWFPLAYPLAAVVPALSELPILGTIFLFLGFASHPG